jgi:predicted RNA-binding protein YlqC (UPF0109 family)
MENLIEVIAKGLVKYPDRISVDTSDEENEDNIKTYHLHVDPSDMGRVIGKQGRIAKAIRTVLRAAAVKKDIRAQIEIS